LGSGPGQVQRYVLDFVEVATDGGVWAVARQSVVLARGEGLSAREGAQQYVRNWRDLLGISDPQPWRMEPKMYQFRLVVRGIIRPSMSGDGQHLRALRDLTRETSHLRRSQKESTLRAIRALLAGGRLEADVRAGPVSIAGMKGAYFAAFAAATSLTEQRLLDAWTQEGRMSARPRLESNDNTDPAAPRYVTRNRRLLPYAQKEYEQELHDAFRARVAIVRRAAAEHR
jgi:hypothetical protein